MARRTPQQRRRAYWISRALIVAVVVLALGTLFVEPPSLPLYAADILFRTWLLFLGTVLAHEGTHGHLGRTKSANNWWGRLALLPNTVPYINFRKTHHLHHVHTNEPGKDPDYFLKSRHPIEMPLRALLMPHQWLFWLWKRGQLRRSDVVELGLNYLGILVVLAVMLSVVGIERLVWGMLPALVLVSWLLWYPFAYKMHEGFSTGPAETRSHNYYGRFMFWFSLGLSMHRVHHMRPDLPWLDLRSYVRSAPAGSGLRLLPRRDILPSP